MVQVYTAYVYVWLQHIHSLKLPTLSVSLFFQKFFVTFLMHFHQLNIDIHIHIQIHSYEKYVPCVFFDREKTIQFHHHQNVFNMLFFCIVLDISHSHFFFCILLFLNGPYLKCVCAITSLEHVTVIGTDLFFVQI